MTATTQSAERTFQTDRFDNRTRTKDFPEEEPTEKCGFGWVLCMIRLEQSPPGVGISVVSNPTNHGSRRKQ